jgi:hypothetical protein
MDLRGRDWIGQLPAELAGQRAILDGLLELCEDGESIRWLVIGCSLARGAADRLSDLDVAMGVRDEVFHPVTAQVRRAVGRLGDLVDSYHHRLPGVPGTHERIFAQYADRCQLDLVVFPASVPGGAVPGAGMPDTVADLDPARLLAAARRLAALLSETGRRLPAEQRAALPDAMARYITDDLASLEA